MSIRKEPERPDDSILDILTDPENETPIALYVQKGKTRERSLWDQIAVIPYGDDLYAILKPLDNRTYEMADDEAAVFRVEDLEHGGRLVFERDAARSELVFEAYRRLLERDGTSQASL